MQAVGGQGPQAATVSGRVLVELVRAVERSGVPREQFMRVARIDAAWQDMPAGRLGLDRMFQICESAYDATGDPAFGLRWADAVASHSFDVVSPLVAHAPSLRHALETLLKYGGLLSDDLGLQMVAGRGETLLRVGPWRHRSQRTERLVAEMTTLGCMRLVEHFARPHPQVVRARFAYPAPPYRDEYARLFGGTESFEAPFTGLAIADELLDAPSAHRDPDLYRTLVELADKRLAYRRKRAAYAVRVRAFLTSTDAPQRVPMADVARALGVSVRSLHRRLKEEGCPYSELATEAAVQVALQQLCDEDRPIKAVAATMGFANVSSFHRAFRQWTGTTPGAYRAGR